MLSFGFFALCCVLVNPWVGTAIFRWIANPLDIPDSYALLRKRERRLLLLSYFCLLLGVIGDAILIIAYVIGFARHVRSRAQAAHAAVDFPVIPRFSISDMLAMVFSLGLAPLLLRHVNFGIAIGGAGMGTDANTQAQVFITALIIFPAYFLCALYRLDVHRVPQSFARMVFLAVAPYIAFACGFMAPFVFILLMLVTYFNSGHDEPLFAVAAIFIGIVLVVYLIGRVVAAAALRRAAQAPAASESL